MSGQHTKCAALALAWARCSPNERRLRAAAACAPFYAFHRPPGAWCYTRLTP